jgi:hypothetical protein
MHPIPIKTRFKAKVGAKLPNGCIPWLGSTSSKGYGQIGRGGRGAGNYIASRLAYELEYGVIPDKLFVLHTCDNPLCVNPEHLFLGNQKQNMQDMSRKRRSCIGEKNSQAKLVRAEVFLIRKSKLKLKILASRYGVSKATISNIRNGKVWRRIK